MRHKSYVGKLEDFAYVESVSEEKKAMAATHQGK